MEPAPVSHEFQKMVAQGYPTQVNQNRLPQTDQRHTFNNARSLTFRKSLADYEIAMIQLIQMWRKTVFRTRFVTLCEHKVLHNFLDPE